MALRPVANAFQRLGIRYYVGGSVASSFHGAMRSTMDVDIVADIVEKDVAPLLNELKDAFYASDVAIHEAVRRRSCFNLIHLATSFKVDVFIHRGREFDESVFARTVMGQIGSSDIFVVPIASAEDAIISKLEWYRQGGEVSERQWSDITAVFKILGSEADVTYLRTSADQVGVADLLQRLFDELGLS